MPIQLHISDSDPFFPQDEVNAFNQVVKQLGADLQIFQREGRSKCLETSPGFS
jgi:hypothetical protein